MIKQDSFYNPEFEKHGYIQVYTGNGKGKTTASLGLAMRALGRGWSVLIVMFTKGGNNYGELMSFASLSDSLKNKLTIIQAGLDRVVYAKNMLEDDRTAIKTGWEVAKNAIRNNIYQLIILDEINIAIDLDIIKLNEVTDILKLKPSEQEIVLTGRNAKQEIIDIADLVSEIKPIKHYWDKGIVARKGIEF